MLSSLPKLADKAFILGFFLPVLLFLAACLVLFLDVEWAKEILTPANEKGTLENLVVIILLVWAIAVLMLLLNRFQYRILEGYLWPLKLKRLRNHEIKRFLVSKSRFDALRTKQKAKKISYGSKEYRELQRLWEYLSWNFPPNENLILPTRFGNAIRAFEHYSNDVYGADSITIWPHMVSVIPKRFNDALEDARSQVNCLVNMCFLSGIISFISIFRLIWNVVASLNFKSFSFNTEKLFIMMNFYFLIATLAAGAISFLAYRLSIDRVYSWGHSVKACFDCYLAELARKLGYELPKSGDEQRKFWIQVSQRVLYHLPLKPENWVQISPEKQLSVDQETQTARDDNKDDADQKSNHIPEEQVTFMYDDEN
jgi:hypothetical protein